MEKLRISTENRKELAYRIGELVGTAPVYSGAGGNVLEGERFRFSYIVMNITIAQDCTIIWDERTDAETMSKVFDGLEADGYEFERPTLETAADVEPPKRKGIIDILVDEFNANAPEGTHWERLNSTPMMECGDGKWRNLNGTFAKSTSEAPEADVEPAETPDRLTIEVPLDGFTPEKLDNLVKMVSAKESLLKAALGAEELPIQMGEDTIKFPWFGGELDADHTQAYSTLVSLLCKTAKEKKRVTAKEKDIDGSPKYAMRCFLLALGFIGDEYKTARKILLSKLEGNSSWKNGNGKGAADEAAPDGEQAEPVEQESPAIPDEVVEEILRLRTLENCPNMFDTVAVQRLAYENEMFALVTFLETDKKAYAEFILTGKRER